MHLVKKRALFKPRFFIFIFLYPFDKMFAPCYANCAGGTEFSVERVPLNLTKLALA